MAELESYTLYLTRGSHNVSPEVAAEILRALEGGCSTLTIPVDSAIDEDASCILTLNVAHVVGLMVTCRKRASNLGEVVTHLRSRAPSLD